MANWLQQLLGMAPPEHNSAEQLAAMQATTYSAEMERKARSNGFPSAAAMMAWARQRNTPTGGTVAGRPRGEGPRLTGEASAGFDTAMAIHPKNIFEHILGRWKSAAGD